MGCMRAYWRKLCAILRHFASTKIRQQNSEDVCLRRRAAAGAVTQTYQKIEARKIYIDRTNHIILRLNVLQIFK